LCDRKKCHCHVHAAPNNHYMPSSWINSCHCHREVSSFCSYARYKSPTWSSSDLVGKAITIYLNFSPRPERIEKVGSSSRLSYQQALGTLLTYYEMDSSSCFKSVRTILVLVKHDLVVGKIFRVWCSMPLSRVALVLTCGITSFVTMKEDL
jgi:hypothetical protein